MNENPYATGPVQAEIADVTDEVVQFHDYGDADVLRAGGRLTPDEIRRGMKLLDRGSTGKTTWLIAALMLLTVAGCELYFSRAGSASAWILLFIAALLLAIQYRRMDNSVQQALKDPYGLWRYHEGVYTEEFCDTCGPASAGRYSWTAFKGWLRDDDVTTLVLDRPGSTVIPVARSTFADEHDWQRFLALLERKITRL